MSVDFRSVDTVAAALELLSELGSDAQPLAGGTDVMIQLRLGQLTPRVLVHLEPLAAELRGIDSANGRITLGALTTHEDLIAARRSDAEWPDAPAVAAGQVGAWQTQTLGTVAGNVANASPAADLVPALLAHDAWVHLRSTGGIREIRLADFIVGRRQTVRRPDELITGLSLPVLPPNTVDAFVKVGRRSAMEVSIISVAVRITLDPDAGTIADARIAVGAAGPVPYRAIEAERLLVGAPPSADLVAAAAAAAAGPADPIDDVRASKRYRTLVLPRAVGRAIDQCLIKTDIEWRAA